MEVLHQLAPQKEYHPPSISIEQTELKVVYHFICLGFVISSDAKIDKELDNRLAKENSAFSRLYGCVWNNKNLKKSTVMEKHRLPKIVLYGELSSGYRPLDHRQWATQAADRDSWQRTVQ